ncbi:MAG: hypothetical protein HDR13_09015 [Lachnospiraceae bacterium]|nr:hypothetical protein [Lachnospiraceae bacterium]
MNNAVSADKIGIYKFFRGKESENCIYLEMRLTDAVLVSGISINVSVRYNKNGYDEEA